jgi:hypothetical protein
VRAGRLDRDRSVAVCVGVRSDGTCVTAARSFGFRGPWRRTPPSPRLHAFSRVLQGAIAKMRARLEPDDELVSADF